MSDKEHKAMAWLDGVASDRITHLRVVDGEYARTLKAMLFRPVLPDTLSDELVEAIWWACDGANHRAVAEKIVAAIRAHLTAPKTKEVEVWHVERVAHRHHLFIDVCASRAGAESSAERYREDTDHSCIRVTGPHKQMVPA